ncbi:MAG: hypothetical protein QOG60_1026 [Frankiaceae bacterium]|nr:hypothetical protein [Frankiaceae bacterium]
MPMTGEDVKRMSAAARSQPRSDEPVLDLVDAAASTEQARLDSLEKRLTEPVGRARWERRHASALIAADFGTTVLACVPMAGTLFARSTNWGPVLGIPALWLLISVLRRGYEPRQQSRIESQIRSVFETGVRTAAVVLAFAFAARWNLPRLATLVSLGLLVALPALGRLAVSRALHQLRRRGHWLHRVVAVGPAAEVRAFAEETARRPESGLAVVAACTPEPGNRLAVGSGASDGREVPVVGPPELAGTAARAMTADCVAVLSHALRREQVRRLAWELEGSGVELLVAPALTNVAGPRISVRPMHAFALLHLEQPSFTGMRRVLKHALDRAAAAVALLLLSPLLGVLVVLIRRDSPGGALFRQPRVGLGGEVFTCLKFRTMCDDAERQVVDLVDRNETGGTLFKIRSDPRITRIGGVLRRYSLDELPQLINVLRGEMSLVGPRPPLQREVDAYQVDVRRRLLVRPGMTGLWQVSGRSDLTWEEAVRLDLYYVENWSPLLDLTILWRTLNAVWTGHGAY